jgi:hypothetical protein
MYLVIYTSVILCRDTYHSPNSSGKYNLLVLISRKFSDSVANLKGKNYTYTHYKLKGGLGQEELNDQFLHQQRCYYPIYLYR